MAGQVDSRTPGAWCATSGNHFVRTFSNDGGETSEKQTRKMSVCGYESGRSRLKDRSRRKVGQKLVGQLRGRAPL